ncbi:integral membrane protein [Histoplasma ohiense]
MIDPYVGRDHLPAYQAWDMSADVSLVVRIRVVAEETSRKISSPPNGSIRLATWMKPYLKGVAGVAELPQFLVSALEARHSPHPREHPGFREELKHRASSGQQVPPPHLEVPAPLLPSSVDGQSHGSKFPGLLRLLRQCGIYPSDNLFRRVGRGTKIG